jgi:NADH:ubiquinone oxidoreductase subunit 5 (subunit L)/multisubunit Na+/H+ antiporter MnhA subunit
MCAGVIIHTIKDSQDIHFMGNLSIQIPFTSVCLSVSSFALCGVKFSLRSCYVVTLLQCCQSAVVTKRNEFSFVTYKFEHIVII